jgi:prefoldin subunit 5
MAYNRTYRTEKINGIEQIILISEEWIDDDPLIEQLQDQLEDLQQQITDVQEQINTISTDGN